jgi:hypothetical protein
VVAEREDEMSKRPEKERAEVRRRIDALTALLDVMDRVIPPGGWGYYQYGHTLTYYRGESREVRLSLPENESKWEVSCYEPIFSRQGDNLTGHGREIWAALTAEAARLNGEGS